MRSLVGTIWATNKKVLTEGSQLCVSLTQINVCSEGSNTKSLVSCDILQVSADEILFLG